MTISEFANYHVENIEEMVTRFRNRVDEIIKIIEFSRTPTYLHEINSKLPLHIPNVLEDSIRFRYISAVELFKKISNSIAEVYFNNNIKEMNKTILEDTPIKRYIGKPFDLRNLFAHTWDDYYLDMFEVDIKKIEGNLNTLIKILEVYKAYISSTSKNKNKGEG
jgi:hypothetical protein